MNPKNRHCGKRIDHFEDETDNEVKDLHMMQSVRIVFTDGSELCLHLDWRGRDCYISEEEL